VIAEETFGDRVFPLLVAPTIRRLRGRMRPGSFASMRSSNVSAWLAACSQSSDWRACAPDARPRAAGPGPRLGAEMRHATAAHHCSMMSNGAGATASTISETIIAFAGSVGADGTGAGRRAALGGGPARAISSRRPGQPRRIAFGRAHLLDRREQRRFIHRASVRSRRRRRARRCSQSEMAGRDRSRVGTSR